MGKGVVESRGRGVKEGVMGLRGRGGGVKGVGWWGQWVG